MVRFSKSGVALEYPSTWLLDEEATETGWTATLQSPGTAFILLSLSTDADDPAQVADQTLEALKAEYPELDSAVVTETLAGRMAVGYDVDFVALDATVVCRIRVLDATDGPLLILTQFGELDAAKHEPALKAIVASLEITEE
ncbi:MAG: hypothetical protein U0798_14420 [Gemmataceae bacterium]